MIVDLRSQIVQALLADQDVKDMLDTFEIGGTTYYAVFSGQVIPESYQHMNNTILIYHTSLLGSGDIRPMTYSANCRQSTDHNALSLGEKVYGVLNRTFRDVDSGKCYIRAGIQPVIYEDDNCWNCPVEIRIENNL